MKKNEDQLSMKNLGMIKMHPGTIRELRKMYEEYEKSLPEGEHKLVVCQHKRWGLAMEGSCL
ncbi:MAG: hypothetical protein ACE362_21380, partial [Phaeodactylibacter xiamenensis]|uniref:hypothetical protein n=1 Tax=Phaeodactylibacter xiamenensis TaxID=1524460 RepID=UPI00391D7B72